MDNGDKPASPLVNLEDWRDIESVFNEHSELMGLTKRERFVLAAMQGLLASGQNVRENFSRISTRIADDHLKALEGE